MERTRSRPSFLMLEPRQFIALSISVLTLFVVGMSGLMTWHVYMDYRSNQHMVRANTMADYLNKAAGTLALERGLTASALGTGLLIEPEARKRIMDLRQQNSEAWRTSLSMAREIAADKPVNPTFFAAIETATSEWGKLQEKRLAVNHCLDRSAACSISGMEWINAATRIIESSARLREEVFLAVESPHQIIQTNLTMKRYAAVAAETAGRERAILAWHIGARQPLSAATLNEMQTHRGVVNRTTGEMIAFSQRPGTDARIVQAAGVMQKVFLGEFEAVRQQAYAMGKSGEYAMESSQWVEESTRAIDTLLAVATVVSQVTDEYAHAAAAAQARQMAIQVLLAFAALGIALLGMTKVRQTANEMFRQKEMAEITLHSIGDAVITTDAEARVEYLNPIAEELTGWSDTQARGHKLVEVFHIVNGLSREPEPNPIEACLRERCVVGLASNTVLVRRDGVEFVVEDSAAPIFDRDGASVGAVMVFYDVGMMRRVPHLLSYHATHDALTGLINRREFERRLTELLQQARHTGQLHALAYFDLDQFKLVNDTCGHAVGDRLLGQITYLLKEKVRDSDTLARLGGDEFGLLLENCPLDRALAITEGMLETVRDFRFVWQDHSFDIGVSIGLVPISTDSVSPAEVLSEADAACFAAKEKGRNRVQVYQPGDLEMARRHGEMQWVSRLHKALDENRFRLYCQTIVPLCDDLALHGEILLRLECEDGKLVPPMAFLPAAERYNLMPAIDRWVIRAAIAAIGEYLNGFAQVPALMCNINLSGASLGEEGLQAYIEEQMVEYRVPPGTICFEITESVAIANLERAATFMHALRRKGCRFALDDFGSGLSSFAYLKSLPVDYLKIDGVFVKDVAHDPVARAMVQAIHDVGNVMNLKTVGEYVEDDKILETLREIGVNYAQGFGVGYPRPMDECLRIWGCKGVAS